jgi:hypothetical protein
MTSYRLTREPYLQAGDVLKLSKKHAVRWV